MTELNPLGVASNGVIRLCSKRCTTCIYERGNLMNLRAGRVGELAVAAAEVEGDIVCHTVKSEGAICRGFADSPLGERSLALRFGRALDIIVEVDPDSSG